MAAAAPLSAQVGLGLAPMRVETQAPAGTVHTGVLRLSNEAPDRVRMRAELLDFQLDQTGTPQFARALAAEAAYSCRQWLSVNPMEADLEPHSNLTVRYTLRIPAGANAGSFHCAVGFNSLPVAADVMAMGMRTAVRLVTAFYAITGAAPIQGELAELKLETVRDPKAPLVAQPAVQAVVGFRNRGPMYFRPIGKVLVLDEQGKLVEQLDFEPLPVLPYRAQRFQMPLKNPPGAGRLTLRASFDLGAHEIQEAETVASVQ